MNPNEERLKNNSKMSVGAFFQKWGTLLTLGILVILFTFVNWNPDLGGSMFMTSANMITIIRAVSITTVVAIGLTFSVSVNGMDLSIGAAANWASTFIMTMFVWYTMSIGLSIFLALLVTLLVAVVNCVLIVGLKIPDMIASLSVMFMFEGVALTYSRGGAITERMTRPDGTTAPGLLPPEFKAIGAEPWIIIIMVGVVLFAFFFLTYTKHGRFMYAVGGNPEAARLSGIPVKKYKILAYFLSSLFAGLGGILLTARVGSAQANAGGQYLMPSVAACFIGFSVAGAGKANALGTLVGAVLVGVLDNGLIMMGVKYYLLNIIKGAVLAVALALTYFKKDE